MKSLLALILSLPTFAFAQALECKVTSRTVSESLTKIKGSLVVAVDRSGGAVMLKLPGKPEVVQMLKRVIMPDGRQVLNHMNVSGNEFANFTFVMSETFNFMYTIETGSVSPRQVSSVTRYEGKCPTP